MLYLTKFAVCCLITAEMLKTNCLQRAGVEHREDTQPKLPAAQDSTSGVEAGTSDSGQSVGKVASLANVPYQWADTPGMLVQS